MISNQPVVCVASHEIWPVGNYSFGDGAWPYLSRDAKVSDNETFPSEIRLIEWPSASL